MKKKIVQSISLIATLVLVYFSLSSNSGGVSGNAASGCSCHGPNSAATVLSFNTVPTMTGNAYVPGTAYICSLTVANPNITAAAKGAGCNIACNKGTFSSNVGTSGMTVSATQISHSGKKANGTFIFTWTAPVTGSGTATLNMAGNYVNGDGGTGGDVPNIQAFVLSEAAPTVTIPSATIGLATGITSTAATLSSLATANGAATSVEFEYGTTTSYGTTVAGSPSSLTANQSNIAISASLSALTPNTLYHFRAKLNNSAGNGFGTDATFTTQPSSIASLSVGGFNVYPNPSNNNTFYINNVANKNITAIVYDLTGKVVPTTIKNVGGVLQVMVNATSGNYLLRLNDGPNAYANTISF